MNPNTEFERFTQRIYQKLVNNDALKPTKVQHNVKLKGKSGCEHQIDVYWEYKVAGNMHRVAIECKNYDSLVPVGKVRDFQGVLYDLSNVNGIMVSKKGFQEGAKKFAAEHGISLKELRRPGWGETIGSIIVRTDSRCCRCLFLIDEEWIIENHFNLDNLRNFHIRWDIENADYWRTATHFPIDTEDDIIRNSDGEEIDSVKKLHELFWGNPGNNEPIIFPFEDGWINTRYYGKMKVRELRLEFKQNNQETTFNLAADDFVEAILEDALGGEANYVPKY